MVLQNKMIKTILFLIDKADEILGLITTMVLSKQLVVLQINWPDKIAGFCLSIGGGLITAFIVSFMKTNYPNSMEKISAKLNSFKTKNKPKKRRKKL